MQFSLHDLFLHPASVPPALSHAALSVYRQRGREEISPPRHVQLQLLSEFQLLDQCTVTLEILLLQIVKKSSSLTNHLQKASSGMMILLVALQMSGKLTDSLGQKCDLNFR